MNNYPVSLSLRLDWSEMDLFGHINNVSYFKYIQASRVNYWERIGINPDFRHSPIGPMLLSTGCRFIQPLFYPGDITIKASISFIKTTSFGVTHMILNDKGVPAAEANDVIVMYDHEKHEKVAISTELRKTIEQLEGKTYKIQ